MKPVSDRKLPFYGALLALVLSAAPLSARAVWVNVDLRGPAPFCVYDVSWKVEGVSGKVPTSAWAKACTFDQPNPRFDGAFVGRATGAYDLSDAMTQMQVSFRRTPDGPLLSATFSLTGKVAATHGNRLVSIAPYITPTGVTLRRIESLPAKNPLLGKLVDVDLETQVDGE